MQMAHITSMTTVEMVEGEPHDINYLGPPSTLDQGIGYDMNEGLRPCSSLPYIILYFMVEWSRIGKYSIYFSILVLDHSLDRLRPWVEAGIVILLAAQEGRYRHVDSLAGYTCE